MKIYIYFFVIFISCSTTVYGQSTSNDTLREYYNKYPQQALIDVHKMQEEALKTNNKPLLIKSLILYSAYLGMIDKDNYPQTLSKLETFISQEPDITVKSIIHSYTAELYIKYYNNNRYIIDRRTPVTDYLPDDMNEWTGNMFKEAIYKHLSESTAAPQPLQSTPASAYDLILLTGKDSKLLQPTLYDFLCHRNIFLLSNLHDIHAKDLTPDLTPQHLLADLGSFLSLNIPADPSHKFDILKIFQNLLAFRQKEGNTDALLVADLERLTYIRENLGSLKTDSLYLEALEKMEVQYAQSPFVVEVIHARLSLQADNIKPENQHALKTEIITVAEKAIEKYPDYYRINLMNEIIADIKEPNISAEFPSMVYPGKEAELKIRFTNIPEMTIRVFRLSVDNYKITDDSTISALSSEQSFKLPVSYAPQDTIFKIPFKDAGAYRVVVDQGDGKDNKFEVSGEIICTSLAIDASSVKKQHTWIVRDWISGKPVKNVKVLIFNDKKLADSVYTDTHGIATASKGRQYMAVNEANPIGHLCYIDQYYPSSSSRENLDIFTDRQIYRPGQTVYFKGIVWKQSRNHMQVTPNRTIKVSFLNSNSRKIATQQVTSNSFGSFSGSFVIPEQTLNGRFRIATPYRGIIITVSEYKRPEFEISFDAPLKDYQSGDLIHVKGNISSFSGVRLANTPFSYRINKKTLYQEQITYSNNTFRQGTSKTNAQGEFNIDVQTTGNEQPYIYNIELTVTDPKGETQTATLPVAVLGKRPVILVSLPEQVNKEERNVFHITSDGISDSLRHQASYANSSLTPPAAIKPHPQITDTLIDRTIIEGTLSFIGKDSIIPNLKKYKSGAYMLNVNSGGQQIKRIFYLYSPADKRPPVPTYNWFVKENVQFSPEEDAEILFGTSAKNCHILYEIYSSDTLVKREYPVLSDEVRRFRIPYKAEYGNKAWVNISYRKDRQYIQKMISIDKKQEPRHLTIKTKTFRDKLQPGQEETWEFSVTNAKNKGVVSEVLALMYDASLDKIVPYTFLFKPSHLSAFPTRLYHQINSTNWEYDYGYSYRRSRRTYSIPEFHFYQLNTYSNTTPSIQIRYMKGTMRETTAESDIFSSIEDPMFSGNTQKNAGLRKNFQETAFFYPQLQTDSAGILKFSFTMPESTTKWKFMALAHTPDLHTGTLTKYATTSKELMVRPNLPRFLRSGDTAVLKVTVSNLSDKSQNGRAVLELFSPSTEQTIFRQETPFTTQAGESVTLPFSFSVPQGIDLAGCRISAATADFSDGEQHLIPILPDNVLVMETLPIYTSAKGTHTFRLADPSPTRKDFRLTFEMASNPIWYAVMALPPLSEPKHENATEIAAAYYVNTIASMIVRTNPKVAQAIRQWAATNDRQTLLSKLEQNSELKSVLLEATPWILQAQNETEQIQTLAGLFDQNRLQYLQERMLEKLAELQDNAGGWSWFPKMHPTPFMTENVLAIMAKASIAGQIEYGEKEKMMQIKALRYLDNEIKNEFKKDKSKTTSSQLLYLYVRSLYRDIPLGDALAAHKYYLNLAEKGWGGFSLYDKAVAAITLDNYGRREEAVRILASLKQYAVTKPDKGMFWPNNRSYDISEILVHTTIMEAFEQIGGYSGDIELMKQWLLLQKQTQQWPGVPATINAIHTLLLTGSDQLDRQEQLAIALGDKMIKTDGTENLPGYLKKSYPASEITPDMQTVKITKTTNQASWGGLYLQYFEDLNRIKKTTGPMGVKKELFIEETNDGTRTLVPINRLKRLKTGDRVIVRLVVTLDRNMQFLHLQDLRAACFEPVSQISGMRWSAGAYYYEEVKDAATNFFFTSLPKGTHVIEYPVRVNQSGAYQDGIATLQSSYAPQFSAFSNSSRISVGEN